MSDPAAPALPQFVPSAENSGNWLIVGQNETENTNLMHDLIKVLAPTCPAGAAGVFPGSRPVKKLQGYIHEQLIYSDYLAFSVTCNRLINEPFMKSNHRFLVVMNQYNRYHHSSVETGILLSLLQRGKHHNLVTIMTTDRLSNLSDHTRGFFDHIFLHRDYRDKERTIATANHSGTKLVGRWGAWEDSARAVKFLNHWDNTTADESTLVISTKQNNALSRYRAGDHAKIQERIRVAKQNDTAKRLVLLAHQLDSKSTLQVLPDEMLVHILGFTRDPVPRWYKD